MQTIALDDIPCGVTVSPDALVVGVAISTNIAFYSADSGVLLDSLNGVHNGELVEQ